MTAAQHHPVHGLDAVARALLIGELDRSWAKRAACRNHPRPDIFSPPPARADTTMKRSESERRRRIVVAEAKTVCRCCPVAQQCLDYANAAGERHGIWGGKTPRERGFTRDER